MRQPNLERNICEGARRAREVLWESEKAGEVAYQAALDLLHGNNVAGTRKYLKISSKIDIREKAATVTWMRLYTRNTL